MTPNPDVLYRVDITNPAASNPAASHVTLAGNFIRGIALQSEDTGYYIAAASVLGSPMGLFRLNAGVSTLIAPIPFTSPTVGGMAFSLSQNFVYLASSQPPTEVELWRFDFDGTSTRIGLLTIPGLGLALPPAIAGLALNPMTNQLYAIETTIDSLILVDQATGAGSIVGPLGVSIASTGGLDFSSDGTNRLFMACPRGVYDIDPVTGAAGTFFGNLPVDTSLLASVPSRTILRVPAIGIGQTGIIRLENGPPNSTAALFLSLGTTWQLFPPNGVLRIDPASVLFLNLYTGTFDSVSSPLVIPFAVPNIPSLLGVTGQFQALVAGSTTPAIKFTNLASLRVQ